MSRSTLHARAKLEVHALRDYSSEQPPESLLQASAPGARQDSLIPEHWHKGLLLNVRNFGAFYAVTSLDEEYDTRYPERAMTFTHAVELQNFISDWYSRSNHDPRAG